MERLFKFLGRSKMNTSRLSDSSTPGLSKNISKEPLAVLRLGKGRGRKPSPFPCSLWVPKKECCDYYILFNGSFLYCSPRMEVLWWWISTVTISSVEPIKMCQQLYSMWQVPIYSKTELTGNKRLGFLQQQQIKLFARQCLCNILVSFGI